jgi:glycerate 2-kinase
VHVLAAPDKFRGSATAAEIAAAVAEAASASGNTCHELPLADGGDGLLEVFGGPNRSTAVTGPTGEKVIAGWRLDEDGRAIIESARACGLALTGGPGTFDPIAASTAGVGELIGTALAEGARKILVGLGGSATTDGGHGAVLALREMIGFTTLRNKVTVCCDVTTRFEAAAAVFGPQKGADSDQIVLLEYRLAEVAEEYRNFYRVDVSELSGAGAAGGLAGGLAALGAALVPGFDAVADVLGFDDALAKADLVVTGEGKLDPTSLRGKVVGGVLNRAARAGVPVLVVVGQIEEGMTDVPEAVSLSDEFGQRRSFAHPMSCVKHAVLRRLTDPPRA